MIAITLLVAAQAAAVESQTRNYVGIIDSAQQGRLVLLVNTEAVTFHIEAGASVTLDGEPVNVRALEPGYPASVTAIELEDTVRLATDVAARTSQPSAQSND